MKKGFTLAEVLVTLGVIGVVSAITMPIIIQNHQKQVTVSRLKKVYSTLSQAMQRSIADNGDAMYWVDTSQDRNYENMKAYFDKYWAPYVKVAKYCDSISSCGYSAEPRGHYGKGFNLSMFGTSRIGFFDPNGVYMLFRNNDTYKMGYRQQVFVDINGPKGPNRFDRDWFVIVISLNKNTIVPEKLGGCPVSGYGSGCAYKIMEDGWKISDDYPW